MSELTIKDVNYYRETVKRYYPDKEPLLSDTEVIQVGIAIDEINSIPPEDDDA